MTIGGTPVILLTQPCRKYLCGQSEQAPGKWPHSAAGTSKHTIVTPPNARYAESDAIPPNSSQIRRRCSQFSQALHSAQIFGVFLNYPAVKLFVLQLSLPSLTRGFLQLSNHGLAKSSFEKCLLSGVSLTLSINVCNGPH